MPNRLRSGSACEKRQFSSTGITPLALSREPKGDRIEARSHAQPCFDTLRYSGLTGSDSARLICSKVWCPVRLNSLCERPPEIKRQKKPPQPKNCGGLCLPIDSTLPSRAPDPLRSHPRSRPRFLHLSHHRVRHRRRDRRLRARQPESS